MEIPVERWLASVEARVSRRRFRPDAVAPEALERLETVCREFRPFGAARAVVVRTAPPGLFRGIVGAYGSVRGAPSCLVMAGPEEHAARVGYVGEAAILEATASGLGTCWVGGLFDPGVAGALLPLERGERVFAVSPLGHASEGKGLGERLMGGLARSHRRKPLAEVAPGLGAGHWPAWAVHGARAARLAPSALNRQPWVLRWEGGRVLVAVDSPRDTYRIPKRLDCGIAMLHFELGARASGAAGAWERLAPPAVAAYRPDVDQG